jgi:DNA-binding LytR/AlgR family response regulator
MVNVIICDDNDKDRKNIFEVVKNFMDKNKIEYKTHVYNDYDKKFHEMIENKIPFKIYLLDIETPSGSGIDIARKIRTKDVDSVIIFLTAHEELGNIVLKNDLMFLSFINKFDNYKTRLSNSLKKSLNLLKHKRIIKFTDRNVTYTINIDDICGEDCAVVNGNNSSDDCADDSAEIGEQT